MNICHLSRLTDAYCPLQRELYRIFCYIFDMYADLLAKDRPDMLKLNAKNQHY